MNYPGGKGQAGTYQKIINQMPPHECYIEPFLGGGAVMLNKRPAERNRGIDSDPEVIRRWARDLQTRVRGISLSTGDAFDYLKKLPADPPYKGWERETLIYLDPPYLMETRRQHRPIYRCELTEADHARLLTIIRRLPCMMMISGYWSELYAQELADWRSISFQAVTRGGSLATEWLWMNYPEPAELHDYRYLGESFRERERIKRKINRWVSKLERMPILERRALSAAIARVGDAARLDPASSDLAVSDRASPDVVMGGLHRRK